MRSAVAAIRPLEAGESPLARCAELLQGYRLRLRISERGRVLSVGDGVAWIEGLPATALEELVVLEDGSRAMVYDLARDAVGAIMLRQTPHLTAGAQVRPTGHRLSVPVGDALLGRVVDPLGFSLDGGAAPQCIARRALDGPAPPLVRRKAVSEALYTGNKIVDTMIPIGRGQRQLILGDNGTGKSTLALDAVIHQRDQDVLCVVVLIGQNRSIVVNTLKTLGDYGALPYTTLVVAEATASPGLKFLAPYAGCAVAEHWMNMGRDVLIVYDDLTTHAQAYRELSLLLRRPPGREAYPGDIFYIHARLLERATCMAPGAGGGSMTALPLVETKLGEIAAYIPTNLISITDGQIYLDRQLFAGGFLPAIDVGRSVSRIGGRAQHPHIKQEAGRMKLGYLQSMELETFTRLGGRLEADMAHRIARGRVLRKLVQQEHREPKPVAFHFAWLIAFNDGLLDDLSPAGIPACLTFLEARVNESGFDVNTPREHWATALRQWLDTYRESP